uniref:Uncharacterized protein n=1 Tax=Rhizophora mucronata TaxID=61149 RepID=A0A2P2PAK6_RHIMU
MGLGFTQLTLPGQGSSSNPKSKNSRTVHHSASRSTSHEQRQLFSA